MATNVVVSYDLDDKSLLHVILIDMNDKNHNISIVADTNDKTFIINDMDVSDYKETWYDESKLNITNLLRHYSIDIALEVYKELLVIFEIPDYIEEFINLRNLNWN